MESLVCARACIIILLALREESGTDSLGLTLSYSIWFGQRSDINFYREHRDDPCDYHAQQYFSMSSKTRIADASAHVEFPHQAPVRATLTDSTPWHNAVRDLCWELPVKERGESACDVVLIPSNDSYPTPPKEPWL
ncbi:hypothetical protein EDD17DRAFT_1053445 [Pisolithus thermaeus]|nr:hypothetical protein EDD17DRAFT_1053445 [Pisolithus thermaeus]